MVTAASIETTHGVEIINPDHVIAHLNEEGEVNMRLTVRSGRGYSPADTRVGEDDETRAVGKLLIDASYSPVVRVSYSVDNARVEQRTDLDKLIIDLETNGTIDPEEAIRRAATILQHQLAVFVDFQSEIVNEPTQREDEIDPILLRPWMISNLPCALPTA